MNRLKKTYVPYRVKSEFVSSIVETQAPQNLNESYCYTKPKKNEIVYLPGERLLIKLGKQNKSSRKNNLSNIQEVARISKRMSLILEDF
jgi:hypothetical protein